MIKAIKLKKIVVFVIILVIIFGILYYKNFLFGNNISKNRNNHQTEEILKSMENYCAEIEVSVNSNKTVNQYKIYQEVKQNYSMQEIKEGSDIEGVKIELEANRLKVSNAKLKLEKVYENYSSLLNHAMFLNTFSQDYKNEANISNEFEENGELILEVKLNTSPNTYIQYKKLHVDTKTKKPIKLEIKDNTKKETICILYNNIELKK